MTVEVPARQALSCSLEIEPTEHSVVIEGNFILGGFLLKEGLIHEGVEEAVNEPVVALCIFKNDWTRIH